MVWGGAFHRHIITIGGMMARPAKTGQLAPESTFPAMPPINAADTQRMARPALSDMSCMSEVYAPVAEQAVPECTRTPRRSDRTPAGDIATGVSVRQSSHARRVCTSAQTVGLWKCKDRDTPREDPICGELYVVVHRRPGHRVGRGRHPPQNACARWREWRPSRLDERAMARRTSCVARTVNVRTRALRAQ